MQLKMADLNLSGNNHAAEATVSSYKFDAKCGRN